MGEFTTTLAGATYRQKEIAEAIDWMTTGPVDVFLEPEPNNPHDPNAVRVEVEKQRGGSKRLFIGYLPAHIAASLQPDIDRVRVKGVDVRAPDDAYDFWNLSFTLDDGKLSVSFQDGGSTTAAARKFGADHKSTATPEETGKRLGAHKVGATVTFITGVVLIVTATVEPGGTVSGAAKLAPSLIIGGLIWYFVTSIRTWLRNRKARKG